MEGDTIWKEILYGRRYYMEGDIIWKEILYGRRYHMEGDIIWKEILYGRRYYMEDLRLLVWNNNIRMVLKLIRCDFNSIHFTYDGEQCRFCVFTIKAPEL